MKDIVKSGFLFSKNTGVLEPATLYIYPTGLITVWWISAAVWLKVKDDPYNKVKDVVKNTYTLEDNKFDFVSFSISQL